MSPRDRKTETGSGASPRPKKRCGCSGVRWCTACEDPALRAAFKMDAPLPLPSLLQEKPSEGLPRVHSFCVDTQSVPELPDFSGLCIVPDFLSTTEAKTVLEAIEERPFALAQSGKWKQHYGAKINFNKRRINTQAFRGLPAYVSPLETRMKKSILERADASASERSGLRRALDAFATTDAFVLRYEETEQSNLDFHLDDTFAYGEGIFDLSLETDSVLTFIRAQRAEPRDAPTTFVCVRAALPAGSLAFLYGPARFAWEHAILAYDIAARRTSLTLRTLSPEALRSPEGQEILAIAQRIL